MSRRSDLLRYLGARLAAASVVDSFPDPRGGGSHPGPAWLYPPVASAPERDDPWT